MAASICALNGLELDWSLITRSSSACVARGALKEDVECENASLCSLLLLEEEEEEGGRLSEGCDKRGLR